MELTLRQDQTQLVHLERASMRTMTDAERDAFVTFAGFGILSLANGNRAHGAPLGDIPPPLHWADDDERADATRSDAVTAFRLVPSRSHGRYSQPTQLERADREIGF